MAPIKCTIWLWASKSLRVMHDLGHCKLKRLENYLSEHLESFSGPLEMHKFSDGQSNPTYRLSTPHRNYVLRRKPDGKLLPSAHAVDREFRVMNALRNAQIPVPQCLHLCDDQEIIGTMFFVMEYVDGIIFWDPALPRLNVKQRTQVFDEMNQVLAALHSVQPESIGLNGFGKPGNYFARQIKRWIDQYRNSATELIEEMNLLIKWLTDNLPEDDGSCCVVHGDYRLDNLIFDPVRLEILAILDWELSTLGHPFADIAYQCMQLRFPFNDVLPGLGSVDRQKLGIPKETAYVDLYCQRRGLDEIPNWSFYLAFSFFRFAAILQGVKKRALDGNASSDRALELTNMIKPLAKMGLEASCP